MADAAVAAVVMKDRLETDELNGMLLASLASSDTERVTHGAGERLRSSEGARSRPPGIARAGRESPKYG